MQKIKSQQSHGPNTVCIANKKQRKTDVVESAKEESRTKGQNNSLELLPGTATYTDLLSGRVLNCNMHLNSTNSQETVECETDIKHIDGIEECYASTATAVAPGKLSPFVSLSSSGHCSKLQRLSIESHEESTHEDKMETDKWEHQSESESLGLNTGCGEHSLGSPVEQEFPKDVTLSYCVIRQKSGVCDSELQESARRRLCILESENKDIVALFNELSARLLSILAEKDRFILTFKTVEEIWKFTTYLSLGFVGRCLENLLFDQHFWLNVSVVEDVKIQVEVNEADLSMMYLDLLLQEGPFFTRILSNILKNEEEDVSICKDDLIMLKDIGKNLKWEATSLSTNETGLLPVSAPQALLYPFYQWFLKVRAGNFNGCKETKQQHFAQSIGTGTCIATVDCKEGEADELHFVKGEKIQIIGFLLSNLQWALGKSLNSGETGFVQIRHMQPDQFKTLDAHLLFLSDEEKSSLITFKKSDDQQMNLLKTLCQSNINAVYRLGQVQALEQLCSFYENILHDKQQCRIYYEHWLMLSQKLKDKEQEMKMLNILSHLHLSFNTQSSYRLSLDYTKQNLRNFIDLGMHFKAAEAWLLAGKLYYLMEKYELVELYFQAAIQTAQQTENLHFILKINEAAGDMFYNGPREREKATSFYRAGAVPLARMTGDTDAELRLLNKLTELNIMLSHLEQALEYAIAAVRLSINTGSQLKEQIAFYRLATVYYLCQQYEMAENYYLKALSLSPCLLQSREEATYYMKVYLRLGDITLHKLKDAHDAAGYFHLAFAAATEIGNKQDLFNICTRLANIYKNYIVNEDLYLQFVQQAKALSTDTMMQTVKNVEFYNI
ncbi:SH3 domain and tetratricopeptide repeat-containing protein 2 isoform X2 [Stegostoma tigrinum]|uniref:SH3 domain and tetratricopeptide repeat-containing protein 2 isoform X2 n=1 Tax=Stegostoma tigrinum TaxID=3053191 RepID=UPI00287027AF|nr:SH3 domain and tetratricopeptide repeat-containing protein 2 isoform X2 [Stegostoma tigrinum]